MTKTNRLLIVTYYWPPSGGAGVQRILKFTKYLPDFGIEPIVLTVKNPTYPIIDKSLEEEVPNGLKVFKTRSFEPYQLYAKIAGKSADEVAKPTSEISSNKSTLGKLAAWIRANFFIPDARVGWQITARKKAAKLIDKYNIKTVLTTGTPHSAHFTGLSLKKKYPITWIADFRDPWSQIHYNQHLPRTTSAARIDRKLEQHVLETADEVLVVSPSMAGLQSSIFDRSYHVVPNGFDPVDFQQDASQKNQNEQFTIRYVGSLSETMIPVAFMKALGALKKHSDLAFRMEFTGNVHPKVEQLIAAHQLEDCVTINGYKPHHEAVQLMKGADLLLVLIPDVKHNELILTGKLFDYMAAKQPILLLGPPAGDAAQIIDELNCGASVPFSDYHQIYDTLKNAIQNHPKPFVTIPEFTLHDHPYSRISLTKQLAQIITDKQ